MKKLVLAALVAAPLCACDKPQTTDFDTVSAAVQAAGADAIIATGELGDTVVKVPATDAILAIYNQDKDTKFLSVAIAPDEGNCLINVVSENEYRVFCGTYEDIASGDMWSVVVTKTAEEPAVAEENSAEVSAESAPEAPVAE